LATAFITIFPFLIDFDGRPYNITIVVIHVTDCMFKMLNRFLYTSEIVFAAAGGSMDWTGRGSEHGHA